MGSGTPLMSGPGRPARRARSAAARSRGGRVPCRWRRRSRRGPSPGAPPPRRRTGPDLLRRRRHGHVGVGDVEDLVAQPVGLQAALHHLAQVPGVDVGEQVAPPQRRVGEEGREHLGVLVRLDDVVDPQAVDVRAGAGLEGARRHLARDLRHRVGVLGDRRVLLVDRHVERAPLALGEADPVGRLRGGEHDLAHPQPGRGLEHVVGAEDVRRVRRRVGGEQDRAAPRRSARRRRRWASRAGPARRTSPARPAPSRSHRHR